MRRTRLKGMLAAGLIVSTTCLGLAGCSGTDTAEETSAETDTAVTDTEDATETADIEAEEGEEEEVTDVQHEAETVTCSSEYVGADYDTTKEWLVSTVYDVDAQEEIAQEIEESKADQSIETPLVLYNPFGTNSQSLYVYFLTEEEASVMYTISVTDEEAATIEDESFTADSIADFTREVEDGEMETEHEFVLYGLIPNVENVVTITAAYEDGSTESTTFICDMCDVLGNEELQLAMEEGTSDAELEEGLYVILGNDSEEIDFVYFYDNDGILRGEMPVADSRSHRLIFEDDLMYFSISKIRLAAMNDIGQIVQTYNVQEGENYQLHHDYVSDGEDHLLVLASDLDEDTVEDYILFVNQESGEIDSVIDMGDLMASYKEQALEYHYANVSEDEESENFDGESGVDWLHINSIQWMGDDSILLSSRETSTIIKISDVYGTPTIDYMIGSQEYWEGTEYEDLVLEQVGEFTLQGGQHCIEYLEDESLEDGQYYLAMYNNNIGISSATTSDFDYSSIGLTNATGLTEEEDVYSYYYKYLVDEEEGTFELVESIAVPYSGFISSVQDLDTNTVIDSGLLGVFGEYDENGELICQFTMEIESVLYRVFKYDL